jgi:hypothetical protein
VHNPFTTTLSELDSPNCAEEDCHGKLYSEEYLTDGHIERMPNMVPYYVPPERALQRFLPTTWKVGAVPALARQCTTGYPPMPGHGYYKIFQDLLLLWRDIYHDDGWGWPRRAIQVGLHRRRGGRWAIEDINVLEPHQHFALSSCGLVDRHHVPVPIPTPSRGFKL